MNNLHSSRRKFIATSALASMAAGSSLTAAVTASEVPPVQRLVGSYGKLVSIKDGKKGTMIKARIRSAERMAEAFQDHKLGRVYASGNRFQFEHAGQQVTIENVA